MVSECHLPQHTRASQDKQENLSFAKFGLLQTSRTLTCNTVFVSTVRNECQASGCTIETNLFDDDIQLLGIRNARKRLSSTRCKRSDGTFCSSTPISNFDRLPCG